MLKIFAVFSREGLTAPRLSVEAGGSGMKMLDYGMVYEQLPPVVAISLLSHEVTITRIHAESTEEQRERFLPDAIAGRKICCTGSTEPDTGSDPRGIKTRVTERDGKLVVNGRKMWITNGSISDIAVITCVGADPAGKAARCAASLFSVRHRLMKRGKFPASAFSRAISPNCCSTMSACRRTMLSAQPAMRRGFLTITWNVNRPLMGLSAVYLAQRALDAAITYAGMRKQFGRLIGAKQLVQERLADIATAVETSRLLCYKALDGSRSRHSQQRSVGDGQALCDQCLSAGDLIGNGRARRDGHQPRNGT